MSDLEPIVRPYEPFPSFADWRMAQSDFSTFERFRTLFEQAKEAATPESLQRVVDTATRWAAIDTGAIEGLYEVDRGFTMSVAVGASVLDAIKHAKGESVARAVSDALDAYEYVLDAATRAVPITEMWIRELHEMICRSQETYQVFTQVGPQERPFPHGKYKTESNSPLNFAKNEIHSYAPPRDTSPEMARLVTELRSEGFANAHPVLQASYAHYAFVCVHPFADGNGRVSRALASVYLYRSPGVPLVIFADEKPPYLDALEAADSGVFRSFIAYVGDRTIDTMNMIRADVAAGPDDAKKHLDELQGLLVGRGGLGHEQLDALSGRLSEAFLAALNSQVLAEGFVAPISAAASYGPRWNVSEGYRPGKGAAAQLSIDSSSPAEAHASRSYQVEVARPETDGPDFIVRNAERVLLEVMVRELDPVLSAALQYRLNAVVRGEIASTLGQVAQKAHDALRRAGYLT